MPLTLPPRSGFVASDPRLPRFLSFPYKVAGSGLPATSGDEDHLRELILQTLFTAPGERVNLPEFGVGVQRLIFEPSSDAMRSSVQFLVTTNLRRWLGDRITVERVEVTSEIGLEETVTIEVVYAIRATGQRQQLQVQA
jgi:phage baseplate assembly protein W